MSALVLDASAVVEYLLRTPRGVPIEAVLRSSAGGADVPALCDVEVASVLRRGVLAGRLTPGRAGEALADYGDLPLTRHGHLALVERIFALRDNFTAYDATYVALAERLEATLATTDPALERAVKRHTAVTVHG